MHEQRRLDTGRIGGIAVVATTLCLALYFITTMVLYSPPFEMIMFHLRAPLLTAATLLVPLFLIFLGVSALVEWLRFQNTKLGTRAGQLSIGAVLIFLLMAGFGYYWWSGELTGVITTAVAGLGAVPVLLWRSAPSNLNKDL